MLRLSLLLCSTLVAISCGGAKPVLITPGEFHNYGDAPLEHTLYLGSDSQFHYFAWSHDKSGGRWKIEKSDMPFHREFKLGTYETSPIL